MDDIGAGPEPGRALAHWEKVLRTPGLPQSTYDDAKRCIETLKRAQHKPIGAQSSEGTQEQ